MTLDPAGLTPGAHFHLATIAHAGRLWEVWLEFEADPALPDHRARLRFSPADAIVDDEPLRTAVIVIEPTRDEAIARARLLDERQLAGLLRSVLPEEEEEDTT